MAYNVLHNKVGGKTKKFTKQWPQVRSMALYDAQTQKYAMKQQSARQLCKAQTLERLK